MSLSTIFFFSTSNCFDTNSLNSASESQPICFAISSFISGLAGLLISFTVISSFAGLFLYCSSEKLSPSSTSIEHFPPDFMPERCDFKSGTLISATVEPETITSKSSSLKTIFLPTLTLQSQII